MLSQCGESGCRVADSASLAGQRVLVVEDEVLIAMDICQAIEAAGGIVVGPALDLREARELAASATVTAAMLDIRLQDETVNGVAAILASRRIPFVFYTGSSDSDLARGWPEALMLEKPSTVGDLIAALSHAISAARSG